MIFGICFLHSCFFPGNSWYNRLVTKTKEDALCNAKN